MSKTALLFPGQAAQFVGMGQHIYESEEIAKNLIDKANDILGYDLRKIMIDGPMETLTQTIYTQPAVYVHSMAVYACRKKEMEISAVAGHSLGEISACVAAGVLSFEDGLGLVDKRARAMQSACETHPSTMAAVLGMEDEQVENICNDIEGVVPANYNCPGQIVISGTKKGIEKAVELCKEAGARRALVIAVGGAFHSPLMSSAQEELAEYIRDIELYDASMPIYHNVDASPNQSASQVKDHLISQVTSPVRWTSTLQRLIKDGHTTFIEVGGKGKILLGMLRKVSREVEAIQWQEE